MLTSFIIILVLLVLVIVFVTWPLFKDDQSTETVETVTLTAEPYEEVLQQLRDLDFDHQSGKISSEDYPAMREALVIKAAGALAARQTTEVGEPGRN